MKCIISIFAAVGLFFTIWGLASGAGNHMESCRTHADCNSSMFLGCNVNGVCTCYTGTYYITKNKRCEVDIGGNCSINKYCREDQYSVCANQLCNCPTGTAHIITLVKNYCGGLVGTNCGNTFFGDSCITNAECRDGNKCACQDKYATNEFKNCQKTTHKSACTEVRQCDVHHFLTCSMNECKCENQNTMLWNNNDECVAMAGENCDIRKTNDGRQLDCVNGAECVDLEDGTNIGICECKDNGNVTEVGGCSNKAMQPFSVSISAMICFHFILMMVAKL